MKFGCVEDVIDVRRILAEYVTLSRWGNSRATPKSVEYPSKRRCYCREVAERTRTKHV